MSLGTTIILDGTIYPTVVGVPTHSSTYGEGGYRSVSTIVARDAISASLLVDNCLAYVNADDTIYRWDDTGSTWTQLYVALSADSVQTANIVDLNVTTGKIADLGITSGKIADGAVIVNKLAADSVININYSAGSISYDKLSGDVEDEMMDIGKSFFIEQLSGFSFATSAPSASGDDGNIGDVYFNDSDDWIDVCVGADTWKRIVLSGW